MALFWENTFIVNSSQVRMNQNKEVRNGDAKKSEMEKLGYRNHNLRIPLNIEIRLSKCDN